MAASRLRKRGAPISIATRARCSAASFEWGIIAEDLPDESNQVVLDPKLTDSDGIPSPKDHLQELRQYAGR